MLRRGWWRGLQAAHGLNHDEVSAPVSKYATLRALPALAADQDLAVEQPDSKRHVSVVY